MTPPTDIVQRAWRFHRPLALATLLSAALVVPPLLGMALDAKVITGANAWMKPLKFAIAATVYGASFLWLLTFVNGRRRFVRFAGSVTGFVLVLEVVLIAMQVVRGTTSHFNAGTPFDAAVFSLMGTAITVLALMNLSLGIVLLLQRMPDPVVASGLRFALFVAFSGMMVAFLMTSPTPAQLDAMRAEREVAAIGAHSVGVPDGGPGLPVVGWSTMGGDLRVPHFVGIHGMQVFALLGWVLSQTAARRRWGVAQRVGLVRVSGVAYLAWVALLTWQALRGQSIVSPDELTWGAYGALLSIAMFAVCWIARPDADPDSTELGLELDELFSHVGPVFAEQSKGVILDALPAHVRARVSLDAVGREARVPLSAVVVGREVDEAVAHEGADVAADGRGVGADRIGEIAERHASGDAEGGEDRPLRASDACFAESVVEGGGDGATGTSHPRPDAAHGSHHVDVREVSHSLYMHHSPEMARSNEIMDIQNLDTRSSDSRCIYK